MNVRIDWVRAIIPGFGATVVMDFVNHVCAYLGYFNKIDLIFIGSLMAAWANLQFLFSKPVEVVHFAQDIGFGASPGFGLLCHYAIGIAFSVIYYFLAKTFRLSKIEQLIGAFIFGCSTSIVSLLMVFPTLGAGWFASKGGSLIMLGSVVNHVAFGVGLFLSYWLLNQFSHRDVVV